MHYRSQLLSIKNETITLENLLSLAICAGAIKSLAMIVDTDNNTCHRREWTMKMEHIPV